MNNFKALSIIALSLALTACGQKKEADVIQGRDGIAYAIAALPASLTTCPTGGTVFTTFADTNRNGSFDSGEQIVSTVPVCNGLQGLPAPDQTARLAADEALMLLNSQKDALLESRVSALELRVTAAEQGLTQIQNTVSSNQTALQHEIDALQTTDGNLASQAQNLISTVNALTTNSVTSSALAGLAAQVTALQAGLGSTNSDVSNLTSLTASLNTRLSAVTASNASLNTSVSALQAQVNSISGNMGILQNQTTANYNLLTTNLNQVTANLAALVTTVNGLSTQTASNTASLGSQISQIANLQAQVTASNTAVGTLQTLVAQLQGKTVEIVNTCGKEKLERIGGKLYGVYHSVTTTTASVSEVGTSTVEVASCTMKSNNGNGNQKCVGDLDVKTISVPTSGTLTYINSVASYWSEIPNGTYVTTDTNNNANGTGCTFTVNNGQVSF